MAVIRRAWHAPEAGAAAVLVLCFGLNMVGRGVSDSFAVFVVALGSDVGWSRTELMGAYSVSLLVFAATVPFAGALLDRAGLGEEHNVATIPEPRSR